MKPTTLADIDPETRARIDSACAFVNNKIKDARRRLVTISWITGGVALLWLLATDVDWRYPLISGLFVLSLLTASAQREVKKWYKMLVIRRVVDAIGHGLTYTHESTLTKSQFREMDLYASRIDRFDSEDQVSGRRGQIEFALHEAKAIRREKRGKHSHDVVVFQGQVVKLDFNKNFLGHTIVVPDNDSKVLGGLFGESESRNRKEIVRLADPDFESVYTAYSTDDQEAHYLLTPKLIELVMKARLRLGVDLRLAFLQNSLYVLIPSDVNRFEVSLFGQHVTPHHAAGDLAAVVALTEKLIDLFDLETRIWTRV